MAQDYQPPPLRVWLYTFLFVMLAAIVAAIAFVFYEDRVMTLFAMLEQTNIRIGPSQELTASRPVISIATLLL